MKIQLSASRKLLQWLLLFFLASCSAPPAEKTSSSEAGTDTAAKNDSLIAAPQKQLVTSRFLSLLQHIDSSGYSFDTARFIKIYGWKGELLTAGAVPHPFYRMDFQSSEPGRYIREGDTRFVPEYKLPPHFFDSLQSIYASFFVRKEPEPGYSEKYFTDGIFEEWKFTDSTSAQKAAGELYRLQSIVWMQCGAHICTIDNYLYIMHTRSSAFYYLINPFFLKFVKENNAVIPDTKLAQ